MGGSTESPIIPYDPSLAPVCGSVAAALLFCWYEQLFESAGYPAAGLTRHNLTAWRTGLGYTASRPQPWFQTFYRVGNIHLGSRIFAAERAARREFLSERLGRYVFYAMEVVRYGGIATLHRNATLIHHHLTVLRTGHAPAFEAPKQQGPQRRATRDAAEFAERLGI